jgi:ribosomal protein S18 acetylase RimI-like enzyme
MYQVRALGVDDADDYRRIRLDALRLHPGAFGSAYEDEAVLDRTQFAERLAAPGFTRYGGFAADELVGLAGLQMRTGAKERHKARLFSMYVAAAHRGGELAQRLIEAVIAGARDAGALVVQLSVAADNPPAQRLYRRMGFTVYGVERRSLKVGDHFHDEELMALDLDRGW